MKKAQVLRTARLERLGLLHRFSVRGHKSNILNPGVIVAEYIASSVHRSTVISMPTASGEPMCGCLSHDNGVHYLIEETVHRNGDLSAWLDVMVSGGRLEELLNCQC
jgi:hypothetical protein